jgi:hypothetical protein
MCGIKVNILKVDLTRGNPQCIDFHIRTDTISALFKQTFIYSQGGAKFPTGGIPFKV